MFKCVLLRFFVKLLYLENLWKWGLVWVIVVTRMVKSTPFRCFFWCSNNTLCSLNNRYTWEKKVQKTDNVILFSSEGWTAWVFLGTSWVHNPQEVPRKTQAIHWCIFRPQFSISSCMFFLLLMSDQELWMPTLLPQNPSSWAIIHFSKHV